MASVIKDDQVIGKNGVIIKKHPRRSDGSPKYRTYEIYQRERVGESTEKIKPGQLISESYRQDPYPTVAVLREHYPCYRNWLSNSYRMPMPDSSLLFSGECNVGHHGTPACGTMAGKRWMSSLIILSPS